MGTKEDMLHENDAAKSYIPFVKMNICTLLAIREGKIEVIGEVDGMLMLM